MHRECDVVIENLDKDSQLFTITYSLCAFKAISYLDKSATKVINTELTRLSWNVVFFE